jgi:hypothetical protein
MSAAAAHSKPRLVSSAAAADEAQAARATKGWFRRHPILTVILTLVLLAIIGSAVSSSDNTGSSETSAIQAAVNASTPSVPPTPGPSDMTTEQEQAVQSAKSYLSLGKGFSRAGLIKQLSSSYGEGFPRDVAVFAVDSLNVDWDAQAVASAKSYMSLGTGFSRAGLIQQLSSSYGEGFTQAQASYAADAVGL